MHFEELKLIAPLLRAVEAEGYTSPTPIQEQTIPYVLQGRDLLGCAQTGTGKTAAFALPILQRLVGSPLPRGARRPVRTLVLTPTRELAAQIEQSFSTYGRNTGITHGVVFGGVGIQPQIDMLRRGVDVLVATPGRLLDLANQRMLDLSRLEVFVLDEADRMLDMGFLPDVRRVIALLPQRRQTLLFSATMPPDIRELANRILNNPVHVAVTPVASTVDTVDQRVYFVPSGNKRALLENLLHDPEMARVLVFTRTKHGANRVAKQLCGARIGAEAIHGNKSQGARTRALEQFRQGVTRVLVATDIAARGIDIDGITHVVNFDLPEVAESYVHRIGRTARAGAAGIAWSFCAEEERPLLRDIERLIRMRVPAIADHAVANARTAQGVEPPATARIEQSLPQTGMRTQSPGAGRKQGPVSGSWRPRRSSRAR
jgi:ATP-dependent RNA helicase RhlE